MHSDHANTWCYRCSIEREYPHLGVLDYACRWHEHVETIHTPLTGSAAAEQLELSAKDHQCIRSLSRFEDTSTTIAQSSAFLNHVGLPPGVETCKPLNLYTARTLDFSACVDPLNGPVETAT